MMHFLTEKVKEGRVKVGVFTLTMNTMHRLNVNQTSTPSKPDMPRRLVDSSARTPTKGVTSCDKPRVGACSRRSEDSRMGLPIPKAFGL